MTRRQENRRSDAAELMPKSAHLELKQHRIDAEVGSLMLSREIDKLRARGMNDEGHERPTLTFEEQIALVAAGKARLVPAFHPRRPDPDYTLGGVSAAIG